MPGVTVETSPTPGRSETLTAPGAAFFVVGLTDRGSATEVITCRSYAEFVKRFGSYVSYGSIHDQVKLYFAMGGTRAHIARVVGGSATKGTLMLDDRDGTPDDTLKVDALDAGAWSTAVEIQIANGDLASTYTIKVWVDGVLTETFPNLATPAAGVAALLASQYVRAVDQVSGTSSPNNNPAVLARTPLSAGTDDRGAVNGAALVAAAARFTLEFGDGIIAIPGYDSSVVGAGLLAHAHAFDRLAAIAGVKTASVATVKTAAAAFNSTTGAEAAILAYPWVHVDDGSGGVRSISPEGFVAGARARAHKEAGPWRAGAGQISIASQIVDLEADVSDTDGEDLNDNRVSAIRTIGGQRQLYGYRSLSLDTEHYRHITVRDTLDYVAHQGRLALQPFVFGTIDSKGHLQQAIETAIINVVQPMSTAGGLYELTNVDGDVIDSSYEVDAGPGVNTPEDIANGIFGCACAIRPAGVAEKIPLRITARSLTETLA